jgi:hypothetical protein
MHDKQRESGRKQMKETNWMENERVKAYLNINGHPIKGAVRAYYPDLKHIFQIVAEEAVKDNRKWISVDERLPYAGELLWILCGSNQPMRSTWLVIQDPDLYINCHSIGKGFWSWGYREEMVLIEGVTHWCERYEDTPPPFTK